MFVFLFVSLMNVKMAKPIESKFFVITRTTSGKVYGWLKEKKFPGINVDSTSLRRKKHQALKLMLEEGCEAS